MIVNNQLGFVFSESHNSHNTFYKNIIHFFIGVQTLDDIGGAVALRVEPAQRYVFVNGVAGIIVC